MSYDASLLASAPKATREMVQEGYNPYILDAQTQARSKSSQIAPAAVENGENSQPPSKEAHLNTRTTPKLPFYRTRTGIIIISLVALAILAAIIGGAVGGTRHSSHAINSVSSLSSSSSSSSSSATASSNSNGAQGVGSGTSTTTTTSATTSAREN